MNEERCALVDEHIAVLAKHDSKIERLESDVCCIKSIEQSTAKMSVLLDILVKGKEKSDAIIEQQSQTLIKINENLDSMNHRINKLENKFENSEELNKIDTRNIVKNILIKWLLPIGATGTIIFEVIQYIKK